MGTAVTTSPSYAPASMVCPFCTVFQVLVLGFLKGRLQLSAVKNEAFFFARQENPPPILLGG